MTWLKWKISKLILVTISRFEKQFDDYSIIMVKALADRLAEVNNYVFLSSILAKLSCWPR